LDLFINDLVGKIGLLYRVDLINDSFFLKVGVGKGLFSSGFY
jgi:hypothetical protein